MCFSLDLNNRLHLALLALSLRDFTSEAQCLFIPNLTGTFAKNKLARQTHGVMNWN